MYEHHIGAGVGNMGWGMEPFFWGAIVGPILIIAILWTVVWKGLALWHSARRGEPVWFLVLLLVNTLGIVEIVYLFGVAKLKFKDLFSKHVHH